MAEPELREVLASVGLEVSEVWGVFGGFYVGALITKIGFFGGSFL